MIDEMRWRGQIIFYFSDEENFFREKKYIIDGFTFSLYRYVVYFWT